MRSNHGRDQPAFTVAKETDFLWVDLLASIQVSEGSFGVAGKILGRCARVIAGGFADTAFIEAKNGDAFSRQVVRQHETWAMSAERFIAVMRPGTTKKNHRGKRPRPAAKSGRACERELSFSFREGHFFF